MGSGSMISVLIVNWNTRDLLIRCLEHLAALELGEEAEIWVVDNGSVDGSAEVVRQRFPRVRLLINPRNLGFGRANNLAAEQSRGRYLLLLNTDCFPQAGAVQVLLAAMEADARVGIAGGCLLHPDGRLQNCFGAAPTLATELLPKGVLETLLPRRFPSKRHPPAETLEVEAVLGAFILIRREAWEEAGGFDEGYFMFLEETDLCLRVRRAGWKVIHVPAARAVHLQGRSAGGDPTGSRLEYYRSRYRFFGLHRGHSALRVLVWGLFFKCLVDWLSSMVIGSLPLGQRRRWSGRRRLCGTIIRWHLAGCPEGWGLSGLPLEKRAEKWMDRETIP